METLGLGEEMDPFAKTLAIDDHPLVWDLASVQRGVQCDVSLRAFSPLASSVSAWPSNLRRTAPPCARSGRRA